MILVSSFKHFRIYSVHLSKCINCFLQETTTMTYIKIYKTNIEFAMEGYPTYPDILREARKLKVRLPDQPIFQMTTTPNPDYWEQFKKEQD